MDKRTVQMKREKETKNTVRFEEVAVEGQPPVIGTLYLQKWAVGGEIDIEVTIGAVGKAAAKK